MAPLALFALPVAFIISSPLREARPFTARTASATHLLDGKWQSPSLLAPAVQKPSAPQVAGRPGDWLLHVRRMLLQLLGWSLSYSSSAEDVLLALVAPDTYRLLVQWRRDMFGGERRIKEALAAARDDIVRASDPVLMHSVSVRSKGLWSTFHKACMRRQRVHDVLAVRLVVHGEESKCFSGMEAVRHLWPSVPGRTKDYVNRPKANGYQALHDTVLLPCGTPMEVQVRTQEMHRRAERGQASHRRYKGRAHELPAKLLSDISSLARTPLPDQSRLPLAFA